MCPTKVTSDICEPFSPILTICAGEYFASRVYAPVYEPLTIKGWLIFMVFHCKDKWLIVWVMLKSIKCMTNKFKLEHKMMNDKKFLS